jgi:hypothetical protein
MPSKLIAIILNYLNSTMAEMLICCSVENSSILISLNSGLDLAALTPKRKLGLRGPTKYADDSEAQVKLRSR